MITDGFTDWRTHWYQYQHLGRYRGHFLMLVLVSKQLEFSHYSVEDDLKNLTVQCFNNYHNICQYNQNELKVSEISVHSSTESTSDSLWRESEGLPKKVLLCERFKGNCIIFGGWYSVFLKSSSCSASVCLSVQLSLRVAPSLPASPVSEGTAVPFMPQLSQWKLATGDIYGTHTHIQTFAITWNRVWCVLLSVGLQMAVEADPWSTGSVTMGACVDGCPGGGGGAWGSCFGGGSLLSLLPLLFCGAVEVLF